MKSLSLHQGAIILLDRSLRPMKVGEKLKVLGQDRALNVHLRTWARAQGHGFSVEESVPVISRGSSLDAQSVRANYAGSPSSESLRSHPPAEWGFAARGSLVEASVSPIPFLLNKRDEIWTEQAPRMYAQALAAQWDPETAIDWNLSFDLPDDVEDALVQVLTYLIENETAALIVPSRFLGQVHPYFREVMQVLAIQVADEARHIEVFSRRAALRRDQLGLSTAGGQASLKTLLEEPDFALASFLLSVLGEGSFLQLLWFLFEHAPDPITREIMKLAAQDEARHVAFGLAHLQHQVEHDPSL
ncbi:MAG: ferritin-like domain-containing protein, partial [Planctomycetota bacterium]|nr:ferritin-like domain-containing protein [Planctomycetota bacterium]